MFSAARTDIFELSPEALTAVLAEWQAPRFRTAQVIAAAWSPGAEAFSGVCALPRSLRSRLDERFVLPAPPKPVRTLNAPDGTVKAVFSLADGAEIESVGIPQGRRLTFCLSSQVGCALGCRFCATARLGFRRNLSAGELIAQVRGLAAWMQRPPTNLVFMGMGEPLQNLPALRSALALLTHPQALNWSPHKTTVSTSGWVPGLEALAAKPLPAKLAFSLNAVSDDLRSRLMPVNRRYPLERVLAALRAYARRDPREIAVEYVLLAGTNDRPEDARRLGRLLRTLPVKINLIAWNPVPGLPFRTPGEDAIAAFRRELRSEHHLVTQRLSRGAEIGAACGQLAGRAERRAA